MKQELTLLERYFKENKESGYSCDRGYWPNVRSMRVDPANLIAIGFVRFNSGTLSAESISLAITVEDEKYYISTDYRDIRKTKIEKRRALELRDRFENNVRSHFPDMKSQYLYENGSKQNFFLKYFGWDDSYRTVEVFSAINCIWLEYKSRSAFNALKLSKLDIDTDELKNKFYVAGKFVGSEFMRIPINSTLMGFINEIRELNNFHFEQGFKEGILLNSPLPDIDLDNGKLKELADQIISNSERTFLQNCKNSSGDFDFPFDKDTAKEKQLLKVISDYLPMASDKCDGTEYMSLINEQVGFDIVEQARNALICIGYQFSQDEKQSMYFLKWPVEAEEAAIQAKGQLSTPFFRKWEEARDYHIYGTRGRHDGEIFHAVKTFIACLTQQTNSTDLNPENIFVRVIRSANDGTIVDKKTLNGFVDRLRETCGSVKYDRFVGVEPAPLIFDSCQFNCKQLTDDYDELTFWDVTCSPSANPVFWSTLLELSQISGQSIQVTPRDRRYSNYEISISQVTSKTITIGTIGNYRTVRYDMPLSELDLRRF